MRITGRAIGTTLNVELPGAWEPTLTAGAFQGSDDAGDRVVSGLYIVRLSSGGVMETKKMMLMK